MYLPSGDQNGRRVLHSDILSTISIGLLGPSPDWNKSWAFPYNPPLCAMSRSVSQSSFETTNPSRRACSSKMVVMGSSATIANLSPFAVILKEALLFCAWLLFLRMPVRSRMGDD